MFYLQLQCGGSTKATKVVSVNQSQREQEEWSEHEQVNHERKSGAVKAAPGLESGKVASWKNEHLIEPIVSEQLSKRQQEQIRRDTVMSQEKGGEM